jgi:hypothetical protein
MYGQINKLFIIGNGFDLAHGLKTRYSDFIDNFWEWEKTRMQTSNNFVRSANDYSYIYDDEILNIKTPKILKDLPDDYFSHSAKGFQWFKYLASDAGSSKYLFNGVTSSKVSITIKNRFLENISETLTFKNWVDIEGIYYTELKNCFTSEYEKSAKSNYYINNLIIDFSHIRSLLEDYLIKTTKNQIEIIPSILDKFNHIIQPNLYPNNDRINNSDIIMFLDFNYTNTVNIYYEYFKNLISQEIRCIHIHGEINNSKNPIIFGYGDELDEDHKKIESINNKQYLENEKSVNYAKTPNYRNLLNFIDAYQFDVYIMGHSCGKSDRTLLNSIFEHKNCKNIKSFYYIDEDGINDQDDRIMNLYLNFKDKSLFRAKVIDKTNCEPLI